MTELSKRTYTKNIHGGVWNVLIPVAAGLFRLHAYGLFAAGTAVLYYLDVDRKISQSRIAKKDPADDRQGVEKELDK